MRFRQRFPTCAFDDEFCDRSARVGSVLAFGRCPSSSACSAERIYDLLPPARAGLLHVADGALAADREGDEDELLHRQSSGCQASHETFGSRLHVQMKVTPECFRVSVDPPAERLDIAEIGGYATVGNAAKSASRSSLATLNG
jgi:hypothetical protein